MIRFTTSRLFVAATISGALMLPVAAQAKTDHTANHMAQEQKEAAKIAGKDFHRATTTRSDADKVVDALTTPEKKVFRGMSSAEKTVARHMAHMGKQIL